MPLYDVLLMHFMKQPIDQFFKHPDVMAAMAAALGQAPPDNGPAPAGGISAASILSGTLSNARLSAQVTLLGNLFNGANQLVRLDSKGRLPRINGSLLTGVSGGGAGGPIKLPSNLTQAGNSFNNVGQLLKLIASEDDASLPALPEADGSKLKNIVKAAIGGTSMDEEGRVRLGGAPLDDDAEVPLNGKKVRFAGEGANFIEFTNEGMEGVWQAEGEGDVEQSTLRITITEFFYSHILPSGQGSSIQINDQFVAFTSKDAAGNNTRLQMTNGQGAVFSFTDKATEKTIGLSIVNGTVRFGVADGIDASDFAGMEITADQKVKLTGTMAEGGGTTDSVLFRAANGELSHKTVPDFIEQIRTSLNL
jgi:hypothetical protein